MNPIIGLIDGKIVRILETFIKNSGKQMYLREISKLSGVPVATTVRILERLSDERIIKETRISKFTFYMYIKNKKIEESMK